MKHKRMFVVALGALVLLALGLALLRPGRSVNRHARASKKLGEPEIAPLPMPVARPAPVTVLSQAAVGTPPEDDIPRGPAQATAPFRTIRPPAVARSVGVIALALMTLGLALMARGQFAWGAVGATVRVDSASVSAGGSVTVSLDALNVPAPGVAAITIDVQYDNTVIDATACAPGGGQYFCNPNYPPNDPSPDKVRMTAVSLSAFPGNIALAEITFHAVGQPGQCSALNVQIVTFTDPDGQPISVSDQDGQICISGPTTTPTPQPTASPEPTAPGPSPTPAPAHTAAPTSTATATATLPTEEPPLISAAMAPGWNYQCYVGNPRAIEEALAAATGKISAVYRLGDGGAFDRWFPNRPDASTLTTVNPGDTLFSLTSDSFVWTQAVSDAQSTVDLDQGWNAVCYSGGSGPVEEATQGLDVPYAVIYSLASDQTWRRFVPGKPEFSNLSQLSEFTPVLVLVTGNNGHWDFSP